MEFTFDLKNFPSLLLKDFPYLWNPVSLFDLDGFERDGLVYLLAGLGIDWELTDTVLLVKAQDKILKSVYGPAIFKDGDALVLKVGDFICACEEKAGKLYAGNLAGKISLEAKEDVGKNIYYKATATFFQLEETAAFSQSEDESIGFTIPIILERDCEQSKLKAAVSKDKSIVSFVAPIPGQGDGSGYEEIYKMQELPLGEYEVVDISPVASKLGGTSYKLRLATGQSVWARGNTLTLLDSGWQKPPEKPLTLIISSIEELSEGKYKVENALRLRKPLMTSQPNRAQLPAAQLNDVIDVESEATPPF